MSIPARPGATPAPTLASLTDEPCPHFGLDVPFIRELGLIAVAIEEDRVVGRMPYDRRLTNSRGEFHGGALMSALDFILSVSARRHDPLNLGVVTIEMSTHFIATARSDLTIDSRLIRRGARIVFCEGSVIDEKGELLCLARGAFKLVPRHRGEAGTAATARPQAEGS